MMTLTTLTTWGWKAGWQYGLMGLPLAFCALPLYILLPNWYARSYGMPLATVGWVMLAARLLDALLDPFIGRWIDRLYRASATHVLKLCAFAALSMAAGFYFLFFPLITDMAYLPWYLGGVLVVTYTAFSVVMVAHQAWGALLGGGAVVRSQIVAWREGFSLAGVMLAAVLPELLGLGAMTVFVGFALGAGWLAWTQCRRPASVQRWTTPGHQLSLARPWQVHPFRRLLAVFMLNGIASSLPATLVLFFIQDRLQAPSTLQALALAVYFGAAALSIPLWVQSVRLWGLARSWLMGMCAAVLVFASAFPLGAGDAGTFLWISALSGIALGSDLVIPTAMLAGVVATAGDQGHAEATYFGWWNLVSKLNLALAAGLALPLLAYLGYAPGTRDPQALQALSLAYCLVPCALKALALVFLYLFFIRMPSKP